MSEFSVQPASLSDFVAKLKQLDARLEDKVLELNELSGRLDLSWEGDWAVKHNEARMKLQNDIDSLRVVLTKMSKNVQTSHDNYTSAISAEKRMVG